MTILFLGFMLATVLALFIITRVGVERITHRHYLQRVDFFKEHPINEKDIVMVGDSLTAGANWDEIFPDIPIKNRGINADLTTGLLARLDEITQGKPAAMFILIGTNDLPWYEYRHDEMILETYSEILRKMKKDSPGSKIYVQSLLPRGRRYAKRIVKLNDSLRTLAQEEGITYIDLYSHFVGEHGELRADLNNDHLHLLGKGYRIWQGILAPYIYSLKKH
jgi:lysophospholipase L1-like esterase